MKDVQENNWHFIDGVVMNLHNNVSVVHTFVNALYIHPQILMRCVYSTDFEDKNTNLDR